MIKIGYNLTSIANPPSALKKDALNNVKNNFTRFMMIPASDYFQVLIFLLAKIECQVIRLQD